MQVSNEPYPLVTPRSFIEVITELGISPKTSLLVHCALSAFGRVQGGAQAVLEALTGYCAEGGTLVMPTFTNGRFDPSEWGNPPAPESSWDRIRQETPLYDARRTPVDASMSCVYELFRTWPGVRRTDHPHSSFAAWGRHRDRVLAHHALDSRFGPDSPLGVLYELDSTVLFLGTGFATNTCFHLGEYLRDDPPKRTFMIMLPDGARRKLHTYQDVDTDSSVFEALGASFERQHAAKETTLNEARCRAFSLREAVDFARQNL